jgi:hypothetical protein
MNPQYPIYIISKGRWESRFTSKALEEIDTPYYIVVEQQEYDKYASVIDSKKILILPQKYLDEYDTFWEREIDKRTGPGAARNFCWEHSISLGAERHWVMDDNIGSFLRLNNNKKIKVASGTILKIMEDFVDRYENVAIAGPNYDFFAKAKQKIPPFILNTRIYSCLLIKNDIPYRWRGRYNEDTDLSLRALKDGWCTVQFNAFLQDKANTQTMKGGNTDEFYAKEGTSNKSKILKEMHLDVTKLVWKFGRYHHYTDYHVFKNNELVIKQGITIEDGINNYGMVLKNIKE